MCKSPAPHPVSLQLPDRGGPVRSFVRSLARPLFILLTLGLTGLGVRAAVTGQWDFENGDLAATIGQDMSYLDGTGGDTESKTRFGTTTTFGIAPIGGQVAKVMKFPKTVAESGGFVVPHGAAPNGGGGLLNQYTIIMDILFPDSSSGRRRALVQSDFSGNADYFVIEANAIGADGGPYDGSLTPSVWHRIAFAVDLSTTPGVVDKFIDGVKVGSQSISGLDGRWALNSEFYLFTDDNDETEEGYLNSLQVTDVKLSDGLIAALGGPNAAGILSGPPPNPYVAFVSPAPETARVPQRSPVSPTPTILIEIQDGVSKVATNTIEVKFDNQTVVPQITQNGATTTVTFTPPGILAPLSVHTNSISFQDNSGQTNRLGTQWQFAVGPYVSLAANAATPLGSANTPGFVIRTVQGPPIIPGVNNPTNLPVTVSRAIQQLNGTLVDVNGDLVVDESAKGPNLDGSFNIDSTIDFSTTGGPVGNFSNDILFPGIPGTTDHSTQFATEVLTYLQLTAGIHRFGVSVNVSRVDVNDDDGYTLFDGSNPRSFFSPVVGAFQNLTGGFPENAQNNNEFTFYAPTAGIYPFRLVFYQGGREASLEWYSVDPGTGEKIAINDLSNPAAIKAFRVSTAPITGAPYIADVSPRPDTSGNDPANPLKIYIQNQRTQLDPASIHLFFNNAEVVPGRLQNGTLTTLTYQPARTEVTNVVRLVFADSASPPNTVTQTWQYGSQAGAVELHKVTGQWDFNNGNLAASVGQALEYLDGPNGQTAGKTRFGTTTQFSVPDIGGQPAQVMCVPGDLSRDIGYIMRHGILPNGGGTRVNQYTLIMDLYLDSDSQGASSLLQINSLNNTDDGDYFWQGQLFGQGQGGYDGATRFTNKAWHRVSFAVDLAATPPVITKYLDGVKHADWVQVGLDQDRRALKEFAILFGDGDQDERLPWYVNSIQIREGKLSDAELEALGGPTADGIPIVVTAAPAAAELRISQISVTGSTVTIQWAGGSGPYQLQKKTSLSDAGWQDIGAPTSALTATDTVTGATAFYRVVKP